MNKAAFYMRVIYVDDSLNVSFLEYTHAVLTSPQPNVCNILCLVTRTKSMKSSSAEILDDTVKCDIP